jgi:hypothetical protein
VWVLEETIKNEVMVFERKVLRRIFGPTKEKDGTWRIKTNDELDELIRHKNIINYIKAFTSNARRENDKKGIKVETDVNTTTRETKEEMGR